MSQKESGVLFCEYPQGSLLFVDGGLKKKKKNTTENKRERERWGREMLFDYAV